MAIDADRAALHALLDEIPDERLADAKAALEPLVGAAAPGFPDVPEDDEPVTDEDLEAIERGHQAYLRGELIPLSSGTRQTRGIVDSAPSRIRALTRRLFQLAPRSRSASSRARSSRMAKK